MDYNKVLATIHRIFYENKDEKLCLFIDGQWGIGKTHTINEFKEKYKEAYDIKYISVFGKESLKDIERDVIMQMMPLMNLKKEFMDKSNIKIFGNVLKDIGERITGVDLDFTKYINNISIENIESDSKMIICIDDLERKSRKIALKDILGFIERATSKFNVILVGSSMNFSESEKNDFLYVKEKIVDYEFIVDELNIETLSKIIHKKIGGIDKKLENVIIETFKKSRLKKELPLNNLRIFKKYVDLISRLNAEINNIFNYDKFNLDETLIDICNYTVYKNYLFGKSNEKEYNYNLSYYKAELKKVIENIFKYEEYNKDIIKEYFEDYSEIQTDMRKLRSAYKLTKEEIIYILKKINRNIENKKLNYFIKQKYVISIYDVLKDLGVINRFKSGLYEISEMLYIPETGIQPDEFNHEDWNYVDYSGEQGNYNVLAIIKHINEYNIKTYKNYLYEQFKTAIKNESIDEILNLIGYVSFDDEEYFDEVFQWGFKKLDDGFKEDIWRILSLLVYSTNSNIVNNYISSMLKTEKEYINKSRLKQLDEILSEKMYYEYQEESLREYNLENGIE